MTRNELLRRKIYALLEEDPTRSAYGIAKQLKIARTTANRHRHEFLKNPPEGTHVRNTSGLGKFQNGNQASTTHGAKTPAIVQPLAEKHFPDLRRRFPVVSDDIVWIQAWRKAQLELLAKDTDQFGVLRNRRGEIRPSVALMRSLSRDFEAREDKLVELQDAADKAAKRVEDPFVALLEPTS